MNERDAILERLERDFGNPEIDDLLERAVFYNEYIKNPDVTDDEAITVAKNLNRDIDDIGIAGGVSVFITGEGWLLDDMETDEDGNICLKDHQYQHFTEREVKLAECILQMQPEIAEDGVATQRQLYLRGRVFHEEEGEDPYTADCMIELVEGTKIRYEGITYSSADAWLDYYPDIKESLFELLANAESPTDAMMNLAEYSVDTGHLSQELRSSLMDNLQVYTERHIHVERQLPYVVSVVGDVEVYNDEIQGYVLCTIDEQQRPEAIDNDEGTEVYPVAGGGFVSHDGKDVLSCRVPLATLKSIVSMRELME